MSTSSPPERESRGTGDSDAPEAELREALSLPPAWEFVGDSMDGLLLVKNRNQSRWQSISVDISQRNGKTKIRARYRKAPYRRDRVGRDPVERAMLESVAEAIDWVQERL